jgi:hypothetical protein
MPIHDIINNRNEKPLDHLNGMLCSCDLARFAVGYDQHNLKDVTSRRSLEMEEKAIPHIICSEAFVYKLFHCRLFPKVIGMTWSKTLKGELSHENQR